MSNALVCGVDSNLLDAVMSFMHEYDAYKTGQKKTLNMASSISNGDENCRFLVVDTKYFTVKVNLKYVLLHHSIEMLQKLEIQQQSGKTEGIILVCSNQKQIGGNETSAKNICSQFTEVNNYFQGIQLRIVLLINNEGESHSDREEYFLWSIDNGYEFIEINIFEDLSQGWTEREKDGFPRLVEAFHSQTWTAMCMKTKDSDASPYCTPSCILNTSSLDSVLLETQPIIAPGDLDAASLDTSPNESEELTIHDNFSKLIDEAKKIHTDAMSSNISDQERRDRAQQMAMKFIDLMGISDDDDDDCDDMQ